MKTGLGWRLVGFLASAIAVVGVLRPLAAEWPPAGLEFQVNTYTTGAQSYPAVAIDTDGDFVVVWHGQGGASPCHSLGCTPNIYAQRYASDGSALGSEFQVGTLTFLGLQPAVEMDADGDFVVVWQSQGSSGTDTDWFCIQGQRYASDGAPTGGEFQVNNYTTDAQKFPAVAMDPDGDFVVVWSSMGSHGTDTSHTSIQAQRFASDGSALGSEFQVNTFTTDYQNYPAIAMDGSGNFVVAWWSRVLNGMDPASLTVQGQRYASDGTPTGSEFQVNNYTTDAQKFPAVAMDSDGDFVVVWSSMGSNGTDASDTSIQAQRYASDGSTLESEFQVNSYTTDTQAFPTVVKDADAGFVVAWLSWGSSGTDTIYGSIWAQHYASDGMPTGSEFQVNTYTTHNQSYPAVAMDMDGDFVVAWQSHGSSGTDTHSYSIQAQRYLVSVFADGFESGNTTLWSSTVP